MILEIVILAAIAAFLGLRLYSVLGRRAEHEVVFLPVTLQEREVGLENGRHPEMALSFQLAEVSLPV